MIITSYLIFKQLSVESLLSDKTEVLSEDHFLLSDGSLRVERLCVPCLALSFFQKRFRKIGVFLSFRSH